MMTSSDDTDTQLTFYDLDEIKIVSTQINLYVSSLRKHNYEDRKNKIIYHIEKSDVKVYEDLLIKLIHLTFGELCGNSKEFGLFDNLQITLLYDMLKLFPEQTEKTKERLIHNIFNDKEMLTISDLSMGDFLKHFIESDKQIVDALQKKSDMNDIVFAANEIKNLDDYFNDCISKTNEKTLKDDLIAFVFYRNVEEIPGAIVFLIKQIAFPSLASNNFYKNIKNLNLNEMKYSEILSKIVRQILETFSFHKLGTWENIWDLLPASINEEYDEKNKLNEMGIYTLFLALQDDNHIDSFLQRQWPWKIKLILFHYLFFFHTGNYDFRIQSKTNTNASTVGELQYKCLRRSFLETFVIHLGDRSKTPAENSFTPVAVKICQENPLFVVKSLVEFGEEMSVSHPNNGFIFSTFYQTLQKHFQETDKDVEALVNYIDGHGFFVKAFRNLVEYPSDIVEEYAQFLSDNNLLYRVISKLPLQVMLEILVKQDYMITKIISEYICQYEIPNDAEPIMDFLMMLSERDCANVHCLFGIYSIINFMLSHPFDRRMRKRLELIRSKYLISEPRIMMYCTKKYPEDCKNFKSVSEEVDSKILLSFKDLLSYQTSIEETVEIYKLLSESCSIDDNDQFCYFIQTIIEETSHINQYPQDAMTCFAKLFAKVITEGLVNGLVLSEMLSIIQNMMRNQQSSQSFKFAAQVLELSKNKLNSFPQFCINLQKEFPFLIDIPSLSFIVNSHVLQYKNRLNVFMKNGNSEDQFKMLTSISVPLIMQQELQALPSPEISNRLLFHLNNLTEETFEKNAKEIRMYLSYSNYSWFLNYFIVERIVNEPNYHDIYLKLIDSFNSSMMNNMMMIISLQELVSLISFQDQRLTNFSKLRTLSMWFGKFTLEKDRIISRSMIDFKSLLINSKNNGNLRAIVIMICNILSGVKKSKILRPPNVWIMGNLNLLKDIYYDLYFNFPVKAEIELLFKHLDIQFDKITSRKMMRNILHVNTTDGFTVFRYIKEIEFENTLNSVSFLKENIQTSNATRGLSPPHQQLLKESYIFTSNLNCIDSTQKLPFFNMVQGHTIFVTDMYLRSILLQAMEHSAQHAILTISQSSLNNLVTTVVDVMINDLKIMEYKSKQNDMILKMLLSLIKSQVEQHFQSFMKAHIYNCVISTNLILFNGDAKLREALNQAILENHDMLVNAIVRELFSVGQSKLLVAFNGELSNRSQMIGQHPPKISILDQNQQNVNMSANNELDVRNKLQINQKTISKSVNSDKAEILQMMQSYFGSIINRYHAFQANRNNPKLQLLDLKTFSVQVVIEKIDKSQQRNELSLEFMRTLFACYIDFFDDEMCRQETITSLKLLRSSNSLVNQYLNWWIIYGPKSEQYPSKVLLHLEQQELIDCHDIDEFLATAMTQKVSYEKIELMEIIKKVLEKRVNDGPLRPNFFKTIASSVSLGNETITELVKSFEKVMNIDSKKVHPSVSNQYLMIFVEWASLLQKAEMSDEIINVFVSQLINNDVFKDTNALVRFCRVVLRLIQKLIGANVQTKNRKSLVDAFSKLFIKIFVHTTFQGLDKKAQLDIMMLTIMSSLTDHHCDLKIKFDQTLYFRLLSNILCEWSLLRENDFGKTENFNLRNELMSFDQTFYTCFSIHLRILQPLNYPKFSTSYLSLLGHRMFLPIVLSFRNQQQWNNILYLLHDYIKMILNLNENEGCSTLFEKYTSGLSKLLIYVNSDFPEFLFQNHTELCSYLQFPLTSLRNLVLSATPIDLDISKFDPTKKISIDEIQLNNPNLSFELEPTLDSTRKALETYLRVPSKNLLKSIVDISQVSESTGIQKKIIECTERNSQIIHYIIPCLLVNVTNETQHIALKPIFEKGTQQLLLSSLFLMADDKLRYQIVSSLFEHLRYPNIHTYWCIFFFMKYFDALKPLDKEIDGVMQEMVFRCIAESVLFTDLIPWGIKALFHQILSPANYELNQYSFLNKSNGTLDCMEQVVKKLTTLDKTNP